MLVKFYKKSILADAMNNNDNMINAIKMMGFVLVFLSHCSGQGLLPYFNSTQGVWGGAGVSLYIMVSGYLAIYTNKEKTNERVIDHTIRVIKKVYPIHIVTLLMSLPLNYYDISNGSFDANIIAVQVLLNLLMLQSFVPSSSIFFWGNAVSWYLSVYLLCSIIVIPLSKALTRAIKSTFQAWICIYMLIALQVAWTVCVSNCNNSYWLVYINPFIRVLDFAIGMLIGILHKYKPVSLLLYSASIYILYCFASCYIEYSIYKLTVMWTPISVLLIYGFILNPVVNEKIRGIINYLGREIALEMYMVHHLVLRYFVRIFDIPFGVSVVKGILYSLICLMITIGLATIWRHINMIIKSARTPRFEY